MNKVNIKSLCTYPLKSAQGISMPNVTVLKKGFEFDRDFAIINDENVIVTARENPRILLINTSLKNDILQIDIPNKASICIDYNNLVKENIEITIFKNKAEAQKIFHDVNILLSDFLREKATLVYINPLALRFVKEAYNPQPKDVISFNDGAPIHLINGASVEQLNSDLEEPLLSSRFRSNILILGIAAYAEENWEKIKIGDCEFDVIANTQRCSLISINPKTAKKHIDQEPLRTLSKRKKGNKVNFGIYLVPRKLGVISTGDEVVILE